MKIPGIYILTSPSGKQYIGKDSRLPSRIKKHLSGKYPGSPRIYKAIKKYGADAFHVEIIQYPGVSPEALGAIESWKIKQLRTKAPNGYNLTDGDDGMVNPAEETRQRLSESVRKRVENGTHNFLGDTHPVHKQIEDGTHHFQDSEFQRRTQEKRVKDGIHNFLDGEISRRTQKERLENGTHNFLGENHPSRKRSKDGTHPWLGENNPAKQRSQKRRKAEWCYIVALSRFWYEIHDYTLKRRAEFLSKDIPDTSNAEQEYLF